MDIRINRAAAVGAASIAVLWSGCGLFGSIDAVRVIWPEAPVRVFGEGGTVYWNLRWYAADGSVRTRRVKGGRSSSVNVEREIPLIAAAVPEAADDYGVWRSRAAGFAAPVNAGRNGEVQLTWEGGFAAWFLLDMAEAGVPPYRINIERFNRAVLKKGAERPWELDVRRLAADVSGGTLRTFSFRIPRSRDLRLPLPEGMWYSAYPPDAPMEADAEGWSGSLGIGLHGFLNPEASLTALVHVNRSGPPTILVESLMK